MDEQVREGAADVNDVGGEHEGFVPLGEVAPRRPRLDFTAIRERLAGARGRQYWRSLDELAGTEEFQQYLQREFPNQAPRDMAPLGRREFFRVMGATLALAGVGGCALQPAEKIIPYMEQPESIVPGKPLYYSTAYLRGGYGVGVLGETHMGRPIKLEGNDRHPSSLGASDPLMQGSLLTLYDPDRSQGPRRLGNFSDWGVFVEEMNQQVQKLRSTRGAGLRVLIGATTSPTLEAQLTALMKRFPAAHIHQWEPASRENVAAGTRLAFGQDAHPVYHFDRAQRILSLDSNFLAEEPGSIRYSRDFANGRRVRKARPEMNRHYQLECTYTVTGANADHRLPVRPAQLEAAARAIAAGVGVSVPGAATAEGVPAPWISAVVDDLKSHRGSSLVIAGPGQPPSVHALAAAMNSALGNVGTTVTYIDPVEVSFTDPAKWEVTNAAQVQRRKQELAQAPHGEAAASLGELTQAMKAGSVDLLLILDRNPVYDAPADLDFLGALSGPSMKGKTKVHLGLYDDETGVQCEWQIPLSHYLEAWGDCRAHDGTVSIIQPLITPLYTSRSVYELLSVFVDDELRSGYDILRGYWQARLTPGARPESYYDGHVKSTVKRIPPAAAAQFEKMWHTALTEGTVAGTTSPAKNVSLSGGLSQALAQPTLKGGGMDLVLRPDPFLWDGYYSNNGWLQELPRPLTQLTWDNAAIISTKTAEKLNVRAGDKVDLKTGGRTLNAAVWILPGQTDDVVTLHLGYGRERAGRIGTGPGFNAYKIRPSTALWSAQDLEVSKSGGSYQLCSAQMHFSMEGRELVREGTLEEYRSHPDDLHFMHFEAHPEEPNEDYPTLLPPEHPSDRKEPHSGHAGGDPGRWEGEGYNDQTVPAWGMVIDLNVCIGCSTCTIACQAENNIATVGKDQVARNREMHWIRVDNYFTGDSVENPESVFQPVPCMHCEKAPCEPVCPVAATVHSVEGLNEMVYNRCVGTRYCSNNCPYKVRRFNFLQYSDQQTPSIQLSRNPDVTVRSRGVMEKCTYCVQRINQARIQAEKEDRVLKDGDILSACQQACPTGAIVFGDLNDTKSNGGKGSAIRQLRFEPLNYGLLEELNTRPRTTYLAKLRNVNPALAGPGAAGHETGNGAATGEAGANGRH